MSLVAGSAAQPGQARTHPLLPHVSVSLLHYIPPSKQLSITMIYVAAKEQERVSESERGRERESLSCLYLCAFAYINASIYLSAVATKLISGGFFLPYNRWGNPSPSSPPLLGNLCGASPHSLIHFSFEFHLIVAAFDDELFVWICRDSFHLMILNPVAEEPPPL